MAELSWLLVVWVTSSKLSLQVDPIKGIINRLLPPPLTMVASEFPRKLKIRVLCLPDIDKAIGGVKQLYRHVEHEFLGWDAAMVTEAEGFRPSGSAPVLPPSPYKGV